MCSALNLKTGDLDTLDKRMKYTVGVIGCGRIGIFHAWLSAENGFRVCCADTDRTIINNILKGRLPFIQNEIAFKIRNCVKDGRLKVTTDIKAAASQSNIIILTVPQEIDDKEKIDNSKLETVCKQIGLGLNRGSVIIVISATSMGSTQFVIKENLENSSGLKCGIDFGLAYSPLQSSAEQSSENVMKKSRIIAASDKNSLNAAAAFFEAILQGNTKRILSLKTAEALTIFEAVYRDVNKALAREFAVFCEKCGVDYAEVARLTRENLGIAELPTTLFDEATCRETLLFLEDSENLNLKAKMPKTAKEVNITIVKHAADLVKDALKCCLKTMRRARIAMLGIAYARNSVTPPKPTAIELIHTLTAKGARLSIYDPYVSLDESIRIQNFKRKLEDSLEGADCAVIATGHDEFKRLNLRELKVIMKMPAAVVDLDGVVEPLEVEREGLVYRGLGRGLWTK